MVIHANRQTINSSFDTINQHQNKHNLTKGQLLYNV